MAVENGYDGFISYSHAADRGLAKALQRVLHRLGRPWYRRHALRIFRDDTTLAASPDLWDSIQRSLLSARTFVLLASPESAASPWVAKEVALWRQERSRDNFLLVLTDGEIVWDSAAGDFDWGRSTALPEQLHGWFDAEPFWVDLRGNRDGVRKREFRGGAAAVAAAIHGVPKDALLSEDTRQLRRLVTLLSSLLVLALVGGIIAVWQRNTAVVQRDRADQQARVALSRALAAESDVQSQADTRLAAQLAVAAYSAAPTSEARGALLRQLDRNRHVLAYVRRGTDQVSTQVFASAPTPTHVALSPDGSLLAFAHLGDTAVTLWDTRALREVAKLDPGPALKTSENYSLSSGLSFSGDGKTLAADDGIRVQLWDVPNHRLIRAIENAGGGYEIYLSPDGRWVSRSGDRRRHEPAVRVWRAETGEELAVSALAEDVSGILAFDGGSSRLYAMFQDGIHVLDLATLGWSRLVSFESDHVVGFAVATKAARLAMVRNGAVELRDLTSGRVVSRHLMPVGQDADFFGISADGTTMAVGGSPGRILAMDTASGRTTELATHRVGVADVAIAADGRMVASISTDGDVILSTPAVDHRLIASAPAPIYGSGRDGELLSSVTAIAFGQQGDIAAVGRWGGAEVWELRPNLRMRTRIATAAKSTVDGVAISPDQTTFAALADGVLTLADTRSGTVLARIPVDEPRPPALEGSEGVRFLADGERVIVDGDGGPRVIDVHSHEQSQQLPTGDSGGGIAANADARVVVLAAEAHTPQAGGTRIEVWRWQGSWYDKIGQLHESALARDIAISLDGTRVGLMDVDGRVVVVDVAAPSQRKVFRTPGVGPNGQIAFTRDGTMLVQADDTLGGILLWDIDDERLLATWQDSSAGEGGEAELDVGVDVQALADRKGGGLALWQANVASAMHALCDLAGELTVDDRARYLRDIRVPAMCAR